MLAQLFTLCSLVKSQYEGMFLFRVLGILTGRTVGTLRKGKKEVNNTSLSLSYERGTGGQCLEVSPIGLTVANAILILFLFIKVNCKAHEKFCRSWAYLITRPFLIFFNV
jgi:hypothetical protein